MNNNFSQTGKIETQAFGAYSPFVRRRVNNKETSLIEHGSNI
jgi:hypothetical protein